MSYLRIEKEVNELKKRIEEIEKEIREMRKPQLEESPLDKRELVKNILNKLNNFFKDKHVVFIGELLSNEGQISIVEEKDIIRYPAENIVKLLSPLSNENRIKILKLLFKDVKSSSELSKELRLEGGSLYHHIKELRIAGYIKEIERGKYASTLKGRIAIASIVAIAHIPAITSFS